MGGRLVGGAAGGPAGGIVFYDKGAYSDGWRYLEAALSDQSAEIAWGTVGVLTNAQASAIGTGESNTVTIVSVLGAGAYAARLCYDLTLGGYDDWFLPSLAELYEMYNQRALIGGFSAAWYWSSTETFDPVYSMFVDFANGDQPSLVKAGALRVRAIREF